MSVYANQGKIEGLRYCAGRFMLYSQHFVTQLFYNHSVRHLSTKGMGQLANQAQHKAISIVTAARATGQEKSSCPVLTFTATPALIESANCASFDYWVSFEDTFSKRRIRIPAKSHKRLNRLVRENWELSESCELVRQKNGRWQVRVFVQKVVAIAEPMAECLGVDVGITHCVARSDGYLSRGASRIIKRSRQKDAERRRQGHVRSLPKSSLKQQLDIEARRAVNVSLRLGLSLAVESPKVLANLRSGKLHGWARSYFANRARILAEENSVFIVEVNPAYSSQTCARCGHRDKQSRVKLVFQCTSCGSRTHADINGGRVIAQRGTEVVRKIAHYRSGRTALITRAARCSTGIVLSYMNLAMVS